MTVERLVGDLEETAARQKRLDLKAAPASGLWPAAVVWLRGYLTDEVKAQIRAAMEIPKDWPAACHMGWGMTIRNALRQNGFSEAELHVRNLDNIYVELVEDAVSPWAPAAAIAATGNLPLEFVATGLKLAEGGKLFGARMGDRGLRRVAARGKGPRVKFCWICSKAVLFGFLCHDCRTQLVFRLFSGIVALVVLWVVL